MKPNTKLIHKGSHPQQWQGLINPPVYRASTVVFPTMAELLDYPKPTGTTSYGRYGTPTAFALREAASELEAGHDTAVFPSGLAAIAVALMSVVQSGDHLLMADSVYGPTRRFCDHWLSRCGVRVSYYDPLVGAGIAELMEPDTKAVFLESPGSLTFEVQDVPAITAAAAEGGALCLMDNTWATGLFFRPLQHGVDLSISAGTKYIGGHSDLMLGLVTARQKAWPALERATIGFGQIAAPDDCYLALRGLRTLEVRLERHQAAALDLAQWLDEREEVARVLHPALPSCPGHTLWQRDFAGASGLFSVVLRPCGSRALAAMLDGLRLFKMGFSWGGFESLIIPCDHILTRSASRWQAEGPLLRLHVGLEDIEDLKEDLRAGFARLKAARG